MCCACMKRLRTGYDIYNIQSEHVVYRTYSQQPINSFLPILKVMCGINTGLQGLYIHLTNFVSNFS
jgi:hypothetical protein